WWSSLHSATWNHPLGFLFLEKRRRIANEVAATKARRSLSCEHIEGQIGRVWRAGPGTTHLVKLGILCCIAMNCKKKVLSCSFGNTSGNLDTTLILSIG
ncbi:hypothetical protein ACJX0J_033853, partial [Zea mays]